MSSSATSPILVPPTQGPLPLAEVLRRLDERRVASQEVSLADLMARIEKRRRHLSRFSRS